MPRPLYAILACLIVGMACRTSVSDSTLVLKSKCREDGRKVRAEWISRYRGNTFFDSDEYAYNPNLKTCLWFGEYTRPIGALGGQIYAKFIVDVYANKKLIEFTEQTGKQMGTVSEANFDKKKAELMGRP
jgi:hypothetical protein